MDSYAARLCWNSHGWREPTGEAARLEFKSYVSGNGFGHEEWLLDPSAQIEGWQYGFLQPVSSSRKKVVGRAIDVRLYSKSSSQWFYVGRLPECQVLTDEEAADACANFRDSGRLDGMRDQLVGVGGDESRLDTDRPLWITNIRWRPDTTALFAPLVPMPSHHRLAVLRRYMLYALEGDSKRVLDEWPAVAPRSGITAAHVWPDDAEVAGSGVEGGRRSVMVNVYERDPRLRSACIARYGARCSVCDLAFGERYGPEFDGLIHVHHLNPLSRAESPREVDPVADLRPLCPNCHAAVHYGSKLRSPGELRELMTRQDGE